MDINKNTPKEDVRPEVSRSTSANLFTKLKANKPLFIGAIAVIVIGLGGVVFALTNKSESKNSNTQQSNQNSTTQQSSTDSLFLQQNGQGCKQRDVEFSSAPMKMSDLNIIRPLGAVNDGHVTPTDHVYVGAGTNAPDNTYPVLMPADGIVTNISAMPAQYIGDKAQATASEDHRLTISHSCRYFSIFIHIHKLSDTLKSAVGSLNPNESKNTSIELKAGDALGYVGGQTFDWTSVDTQTQLKGFITPALYEGESWKIHTVSPFDLYKEPLKSQLEAKSLRTVAPIGGKIDYDQAGKLIGNWFREGSGGYSGQNNASSGGRYWDGHLTIAPDYIDPASTYVSIGNWTNDKAMQFTVKGAVDPAAVDPAAGIVKFELIRMSHVTPNGTHWTGNSHATGLKLSQSGSVEGTIIFQVMQGEKLKVEKFPGKTATQVTGFTGAAQIYSR